MDIVFLTKDHVLQLHAKAIADYGGSILIRDENMLESALAQPYATYGGKYLHTDIFQMGAAYFYHISQNQPFLDGNKRTGFLSMYGFFKINGITLNIREELLYPILDRVANGELSKYDLADFVRENA